MNNLNLSADKINMLLHAAGKKLGQDPEELRRKLEAGELNDIAGNLDPASAAKMNAMLQNPAALQAILGSDKVKSMLSGLMGQK